MDKGTFYFFPFLRGRPRGWRDDSRPNRTAVRFAHAAPPHGLPRWMHRRSASSPLAPCGSFTHPARRRSCSARHASNPTPPMPSNQTKVECALSPGVAANRGSPRTGTPGNSPRASAVGWQVVRRIVLLFLLDPRQGRQKSFCCPCRGSHRQGETRLWAYSPAVLRGGPPPDIVEWAAGRAAGMGGGGLAFPARGRPARQL